MTDLAPYERIAQRAEWLASSQEWDAASAEYADLLQQLTALGPPDDVHARARIWSRFDAARSNFTEARAAAIAMAPPAYPGAGAADRPVAHPDARPSKSSVASAAFAGYIRTFSFRAADSRAQFWPFMLIGVPVGAVLIGLAFTGLFTTPSLNALAMLAYLPLALAAVWWLFSVFAAVWRRLSDAGVDPWLSLAVLYVPIVIGLNLLFVPMIYAPNAEVRNSAGMSVAAVVVTVLFVGNAVVYLLLACAQQTGRIVQWGYGPGPLIVSMTVAVLMPLLLLIAFVLGILSLVGVRPRTTKVSSSRRHVKGRQLAGGQWKRGSTVNVRAHTRRTGDYERSFSSGVFEAGGVSLAVLALAFAVTPIFIWRIRLVPAPARA